MFGSPIMQAHAEQCHRPDTGCTERCTNRPPRGSATAILLLGLHIATADVVSAQSEVEWFTERAQAVGLDFVHFNGMSGEFLFEEMVGSGVALLDFDNDGDLDVYFPQGQMLGADKTLADAVLPPQMPLPLSDRLYRNDLEVLADGSRTLSFTDVTEASGLDVRSYGMGVATGDIDNDGWVDLYRTRLGPDQLFRNNGDGTFTDVSVHAGTNQPGWGISAAFVDIDRDGWLDLFVGNYVDPRDAVGCFDSRGERGYCGPRRFRPVPDRLYRNRGDGTFADVTATSQVAREYGPAMGVVASDLDADGWVDLYVANDLQENQLWLNQQDGTFKNGALLAGVALNLEGAVEAGMGVDAGDVDADGDDDLFVTHLSLQTNTLYLNDGTGLFEDRSTMSGLGVPGPELNANYNVTELPDGTRLTGGQRISVDLLPPEVLFLPFARKTDMRVMRRFNIGNTQIAPVLDVFNIFNTNTTTSVNNTYGSRWQEISRIMQARYMRIGLELEW